MSRRNTIIAGFVIALALGVAAFYSFRLSVGMERTAESVGTTTYKPDPESFQNQGSVPPGDAKSAGANRTK